MITMMHRLQYEKTMAQGNDQNLATSRTEQDATINKKEPSPDPENGEVKDNSFDQSELMHDYDGWEFYKKKKISHLMVRRYCQTLD